MEENRKIGVIHITLYNFIAKLIFSMFLFFVSAYASRNLSTHHLGLAQYITFTVNLAWLIFNFGGANTLQRYVAVAFVKQQPKALKKYLFFGVGAAVVSILLATGALTTYTYLQPDAQKFPGTIWLLVFQFAVGYLQVMAQSMFRYRSIFYINLLVAVIGSVFLVWNIEAHKVNAYVWMYILVSIIQVICYSIVVVRAYLQFAQEAPARSTEEIVSTKTLLYTCLYFGVSAILAAALWQRPELYLVKKYLGFNKVAEYSVALNIILLLLEPIKMFGGAMQSYFAGMAHLTDEIKSRFFVFYKHYTWLAIFSGVSLWVEAEPIVSFVYTSKYASSAGLVKVLLLGFIPGVCAHLMMHLFVGLKRTRYLVIQDIIVAALFGSLLLFSFSYMTIETVSTIKAVSFMVSFAMAIWYIQVRMKFPFPLFEMIKSLGLSIMLLGVFSLIPGNHIGMILLRIMLAFALYFMLSIQLGLIEMRILQNVMGEFKRILGVDKR